MKFLQKVLKLSKSMMQTEFFSCSQCKYYFALYNEENTDMIISKKYPAG